MLLCFVFISENHRKTQAGGDLRRSSCPTSCSKGKQQWLWGFFQKRKFHAFSGWPLILILPHCPQWGAGSICAVQPAGTGPLLWGAPKATCSPGCISPGPSASRYRPCALQADLSWWPLLDCPRLDDIFWHWRDKAGRTVQVCPDKFWGAVTVLTQWLNSWW